MVISHEIIITEDLESYFFAIRIPRSPSYLIYPKPFIVYLFWIMMDEQVKRTIFSFLHSKDILKIY